MSVKQLSADEQLRLLATLASTMYPLVDYDVCADWWKIDGGLRIQLSKAKPPEDTPDEDEWGEWSLESNIAAAMEHENAKPEVGCLNCLDLSYVRSDDLGHVVKAVPTIKRFSDTSEHVFYASGHILGSILLN